MPKSIIPNLTQEYVKSIFTYCPETGLLYWKVFRRNKIGNIAGYIDNSKGSGYWKVGMDGRYRAAHRIIWLFVYGYIPKEIDHINGDRADNRLHNLREVTRSENQKNARVRSNNTSGIMGVHFFKSQKTWQVTIANKNKRYYLGSTKDFFEACCARKSAELKYGFHPNHGRKSHSLPVTIRP